MIEQFLHVSLLNAGHMISACLAPVPFSRSTRKKLCILVRLGSPFHLEPSPGDLLDPRRAVFVLHNRTSPLNGRSVACAREADNPACAPSLRAQAGQAGLPASHEAHVPWHSGRDRNTDAATSYAQLAVSVLSRKEGNDRLRT